MRGEALKQEIIGHTVYGYFGNKRWKRDVAITDKEKACEYFKEMGMKDTKAYPIYKNNPLPNDKNTDE